jgi:anti-anti-sigma regulatory factor
MAIDTDEYGGAVVCEDEGTLCLLLHGAVTAHCAADVHAAACDIAAAGTDVDVCCEFLDRVDITCWQVLVALRRILADRGKRLRLTDVSVSVRSHLQTCGLDRELLGE